MRIFHLADVHIRGLTRHDEIKTVINALCDDARKNAADHILIAGDIWHTKLSGITPEAIDIMTWVFRSLADIALLHVTLGNHDGALTNLSRQDAISPIISAINSPRIKLYKNSGTYTMQPGVNLCVYSVFDTENWEHVKPIPGEYNIACYHGSVAGSLSETGWQLEADIDVAWFDKQGFDIVMLGDIHKQQFLGYREFDE